MPAPDVSRVFRQFAGVEIAMKEQNQTLRSGGVYTSWVYDESEPTIKAMHAFAEANGYTLRVWTPYVAGTCDMQMNRVNATIDRDADGKWRVQQVFTLG